ncbi:coproporphyrinogen III oxidase [Chloropicon primus]|uniref:coproporphyrinogen oxidase n=1 Tax=Chloropicon primus TaxID=1764295 RepID=A0A5B8MUP3_9CHLO|nr:coproporphyrinogen III oxidase [Chloropicon primus]UPR03243.1 coproporphyrinogen III oxidase [Chloropicon primus]|mmetsp:Transcript_20565/g.43489  ORF Transcript_20565/g.43489 Transcript_20565/m.43489 type:complete len:392 (-) Transcript_20565:1420-2595(-)|eukprot:QDZ24031.1 coproporphyrinogen III oxidase [Chloropicon primus]
MMQTERLVRRSTCARTKVGRKGAAVRASAARGGGRPHQQQSSSSRAVSRKESGAARRMAAAPRAIAKEVMLSKAPERLCREGDTGMREKFEKTIRKAQDEICAAITAVDGKSFHEDTWTRPGGGGGISRVLSDGKVWEKAGVNVSVVYGSMPPEAYRAATGVDKKGSTDPNDRVPFFAAGISSVMHPRNPHAPTMHFNYRYFETDAWNGVPSQWWFGGGTDITPSYVDEEDMKHFHGMYKGVCDKHDPEYYAKFKKWCDEYFVIKHRGETRGLGGIFFDDLNDKDPDTIFEFSKECMNTVVPSYVPIVERHVNDDFNEEQKEWQQIRRGRYVEFNLVYDRGTTFGLKTGGRIESILMSLPMTARWEYDHEPEEGTEEAKLLQYTRNAATWV